MKPPSKINEKETTLRIIAYNVNGFENKYLYPNFFKYLLSFQIIVLVETHLTEEKTIREEKYFLPTIFVGYMQERQIDLEGL